MPRFDTDGRIGCEKLTADRLREANKSENGQNQVRARSDNKTGFLGVYPYGSSWRACIRLNGKTIYLGTFDTPEIAHAAYIEEKRRIHPACTI